MRIGKYVKDKAGLLHYTHLRAAGFILDVARHALKIKPKDKAAWFWWNTVPVPIHKGDSADVLCRRWCDMLEIMRKTENPAEYVAKLCGIEVR
jgi:hypothetical protein